VSRILHKSFKYVPAAKTDIKRTFAKVRAELKAQAEQEAANKAEAQSKVKPLIKGKVA
jgi:hypothetical protein